MSDASDDRVPGWIKPVLITIVVVGAVAVAGVAFSNSGNRSVEANLTGGSDRPVATTTSLSSLPPSSSASASMPPSSTTATSAPTNVPTPTTTEPPATTPPTPTTQAPPPPQASTVDAVGLTYCGWQDTPSGTIIAIAINGDGGSSLWLPPGSPADKPLGNPGLQVSQTYHFVRSGDNPNIVVGTDRIADAAGEACPAYFATAEWNNG